MNCRWNIWCPWPLKSLPTPPYWFKSRWLFRIYCGWNVSMYLILVKSSYSTRLVQGLFASGSRKKKLNDNFKEFPFQFFRTTYYQFFRLGLWIGNDCSLYLKISLITSISCNETIIRRKKLSFWQIIYPNFILFLLIVQQLLVFLKITQFWRFHL